MNRAMVSGLGMMLILALSCGDGVSQSYNPSLVRRPATTAWVASVDRPENCLRVRSGPGTAFEIVGYVNFGEQLTLTGMWSQNNWAEISVPMRGWVLGNQLRLTTPTVIVPTTVVRQYVPERINYVYYPRRSVYYANSWWGPSYRFHRRYHHGFAPYHRHHHYKPYYGRGAGVWVGPRGGVGVRAGGVGVSVGPRGGVRVRVR